jgi:AcrR family transcriptional regulator
MLGNDRLQLMPTRRPKPAAATRTHVLDVAHELFYWQGIRATGVDTIAKAAEVAPTTLYRLFDSKDDLVAAYVERAAADYREWFDDALGPADDPARVRVLRLFRELHRQVQPEQCRGCPFLMALGELPDPDHPGHRHAVELKEWVRTRFAQLARELPGTSSAAAARRLGDQLMLVFEGVYATAQSMTATGPPRAAARMVAELLPE